jgi:hypothetical protein
MDPVLTCGVGGSAPDTELFINTSLFTLRILCLARLYFETKGIIMDIRLTDERSRKIRSTCGTSQPHAYSYSSTWATTRER